MEENTEVVENSPLVQVNEGTTPTTVEQMKASVDTFIEVREYLKREISKILIPGHDFYTIERFDKKRSKKILRHSLGKSGAEKLLWLHRWRVPKMALDREMMDAFDLGEPFVAIVCEVVSSTGEVLAIGRGAAKLSDHDQDVNKAIKMAQKSAYVDGTIRATGLSDFTQDLEDMFPAEVKKPSSLRGRDPRSGGRTPVKKKSPRDGGSPLPSARTAKRLEALAQSPLFTEEEKAELRVKLRKHRTDSYWSQQADQLACMLNERSLRKIKEQHDKDGRAE